MKKETNQVTINKQTKLIMKASEFRKLIREEVRRVIKEVSDNEVVLSNEILDFLEERGVINANNAQKIHKDLTSFLKSKIIKEEYAVDFKYMKPYIKDVQQAIATLQILNDKIETDGPLSEDVVDALESLEGLYNKIKQAR